MRMIDTQILIHMASGRREPIFDAALASVSANEFLRAYGPDPTRARYYVPLRLGIHGVSPASTAEVPPPDHPARRQRTDRIVIDLTGVHPAVVEYGSYAMSDAINAFKPDLFAAAIVGLPKREQRDLKRRFRFLADQRFRCMSLEAGAVELGLDILSEFLERHAAKANFRNTLCDTLILGTALKHRMPLHTEDTVLARLAAARFGARAYAEGEDLVVDFEPAPVRRPGRSDSKGYIHRGWSFAVKKRRSP